MEPVIAARTLATLDANEACASVAHRINEVIAIYPITPASPMGEHADEWSAHGRCNVWGNVPQVMEMQSEGGAAGAVHGALQGGVLTTTFTASQGLLLMLPNLYKIAGELTPMCLHVAARSVATHALSIFGDHSDVMACRQSGFAMLCSCDPQEANDFALIGQAASLKARVPVLHFFDGFRTSHELNTVELLADDDLRAMIDDDLVAAHRARGLNPDRPVLRGTAQNPDAFFQAREAANPFYDAFAGIVADTFAQFGRLAGREYRLFDYHGHPQAERVIVMMGSGAGTAQETVEHMVAAGEKVGLVTVRLYRPFSAEHFLAALPESATRIVVLDRTKEPGAPAEPLCLDVQSVLADSGRQMPRIIGGRYGLSSREFAPAHVKAVLDELSRDEPKRRFTVGITDDVTHLSLPVDESFDIEPAEVSRAVFFGLGSDGTVGANKNSIRIIGEEAGLQAQGYFVYDSKKAGARTISHLRFGKRPIRSSYLIRQAQFVGCHQWDFLDRLDGLDVAAPGAVLLLNAPFPQEAVWQNLPRHVQDDVVRKKIRVYAIDAYAVAAELDLGRRINTVMQTCFFAISGVLPRDQAITAIKHAIEKTYAKRGPVMVQRNFAAVDGTLERLFEIAHGDVNGRERTPTVPADAPEFVQRVTGAMIAGHGDRLPVSAFPPDGTWPTGTSQWEKRNIATDVPVWDPAICIQCNKCAMVCPHAAIRAKVYEPAALAGAPPTFKSADWRGKGAFEGHAYTIQVAVEDCTGCSLCTEVCPAKDKTNPRHKAIDMAPQRALREAERENYRFFLDLPEAPREHIGATVKDVQLLQPLFEYSGACAGCGETPYLKLLSQLVGDHLIIANATGCSSIYGGNLPTTPWTVNRQGRGPAWNNSLFEDNAEFGLGMRLAVDQITAEARRLLTQLDGRIGEELLSGLLESPQANDTEIAAQRARVDLLRLKLAANGDFPPAKRLSQIADYLVTRSVWIVGGDGWAYDIGYGGLDHVLSTGKNVKILVLDTEVYSNTGGQQSKATPTGAAAKFASAGKATAKKDLGMMAMAYGNVYVAHVAWGAKDAHTVKAFAEAEACDGPALIIAYSPCVAHGYDLAKGAQQQKLAMESGIWPLYRWDPRRMSQGKSPLQLDSPHPTRNVLDFARNEARFRIVEQQDPARFRMLMNRSQQEITRRTGVYEQLAKLVMPDADPLPAGTDDNDGE